MVRRGAADVGPGPLYRSELGRPATTRRAAAELAVSYCDVVACDAECFCVSREITQDRKIFFWCSRLSGYRLWRPSASSAAQAPWDGACGACGAVTPPRRRYRGSPTPAGETTKVREPGMVQPVTGTGTGTTGTWYGTIFVLWDQKKGRERFRGRCSESNHGDNRQLADFPSINLSAARRLQFSTQH